MPSRRTGKRRALGQHYLIDSSVVRTMVRLADIGREDRVLEIGVGRGALTRELSQLSNRLEGFELDKENFLVTKELQLPRVALHLGDALAASRDFDVLVSSLPYSESGNFVEWLSGHKFRRAVVLLQRDFVDKLLAQPGRDEYRAISVVSQISSRVTRELDVGKEAFNPQPKVSSSVVLIRPREVLSTEETRLIKMLFSQRRRKLSGALKELELSAGPMNPEQLSRRVEDLSPSDFRGVLDKIERPV